MEYGRLIALVSQEVGADQATTHRVVQAALQKLQAAGRGPAEIGELVDDLYMMSVEVPGGSPAGSAKLIQLEQSGKQRSVHEIGAGLVIGSQGDLAFPDDEFLSAEHARVAFRGNRLYVTDLGSRNGSFVRVQSPEVLVHDDVFLMGRQVFRFIELERSHDTAEAPGALGSPPPAKAFAVQLLGVAGAVYDMKRLGTEPLVMGRNPNPPQGPGTADLMSFTGDTFISGTHGGVFLEDGRWMLRDLGSSNGTWLRVRGDRVLDQGDEIFVGKEVLRVEM